MNPQSAYYLSFNTGYPNAFDKALGRTGSQLMVHGDCSSRGCYAMTDEQIAEIYSLGRESFFGGQKQFQLQAYPFKMTPVNLAKHRNNPNMPFWRMIKDGNDHFEVTKHEPKVEFCEKKYVFDPIKKPGATKELVFDAAGKCPDYAIADDVADAVREKQATDIAETARLIAKGTPVAKINTGIDGGMHRVFAARVPEGNTGLSEGGDAQSLQSFSLARAPGTIPSHVNPPKVPADSKATPSENLLMGAPEQPKLAAAPAAAPAPTRVANAAPAAQEEGGFFSNLARKVGLGGAADATASTPPSKPKAEAKQPPKPEAPKAAAAKHDAPKQDTKQAAAAPRPSLKPSVDTAAPAAKDKNVSVSGSAPIVPPNSFDSRFGAVR
jgi:hypothetical protein